MPDDPTVPKPTPNVARPAQPPANAADPTLQKRILDLESQLQQLQGQTPDTTSINQRLKALEQSERLLEDRLQSLEERLKSSAGRDSATSGAGADAGSSSDTYGLSGFGGGSVASSCGPVVVPQCRRVVRNSCSPCGSCYSSGSLWPFSWLAPRPRFYGSQNVSHYYHSRPYTEVAWAGGGGVQSSYGASCPIVRQPTPQSSPASNRVEEVPAPPREEAAQPAKEAARQGQTHPIAAVYLAPLDLNGLRPKDAGRLYGKGYNLFWRGEYADALRHFEAAVSLRNDDARYLYYQGLSQLVLGRKSLADASMSQAAQLEARRSSQQDRVARALERLQGQLRLRVESFRNGSRPSLKLAKSVGF